MISVQTQHLCDDVRFQWGNNVYGSEEIAVRFHHRLVLIHPFPNGNGRHSRLAADLLLFYGGLPVFTWGSTSLTEASLTRQEYLVALREADAGSVERLLRFARS